MNRKLHLSIIVGCGLSFVTGCKKAATVAGPPSVEVVVAIQKDVPIFQEFAGQTKGSEDVNIRARVTGTLEGIHFQEGSEVKKGTLLYSIDPKPFSAKVDEAKAAVAQAEALLGKAVQDVERLKPLAEANAVPQKDYDTAIQAQLASQAGVKAQEAVLKTAQIDLGYTKVFAPLSGTIGTTQAKVGDLVGNPPAISILNTISRLDPALVEFSISEKEYLDLQRRLTSNPDKKGRKKVALELILSDGSVYPQAGFINFADRQIDPQTGTLKIQASYPNADKVLRPGLFAKVRAPVEERKGAIVVPQRAILEQQGVSQVFVVNAENKVQVRTVKVGPTTGSLVILEEGVTPGERVIIEGLQKVRADMEVSPVVQVVGDAVQASTNSIPVPSTSPTAEVPSH